MQGTAGKVTVAFAAQNRADTIVAGGGVKLRQQPARGKAAHAVEITAATVDFLVKNGRTLQQAVTGGPAQVEILPLAGASGQDAGRTVATAERFEASFNRQNRIDHLTGAPDAKVVLSSAGQPDKTSTSDSLEVTFDATGAIASMRQDGHFHYTEPAGPDGHDRAAWAEHARYTPADEILELTGAPRVVDGDLTTTADVIRLDRHSGDAAANGDVKSTYSDRRARPEGALLTSSDPIHVTAASVRALRGRGVAVYSGGARLWQGSSIVQAPVIEFNRQEDRLVARSNTPGAAAGAVTTSFVQQDQHGKLTPVSISSARLTYLGRERQAQFEGGVVLRTSDTTVTAQKADMFWQARSQTAGASGPPAPSQIERIVAEGQVNIQQPGRRATGERLVYTASDGRFVLVGGPPSIFDAERGTTTGGSLTFFNRDDRVVVDSSNSSPTVTHTRVAK